MIYLLFAALGINVIPLQKEKLKKIVGGVTIVAMIIMMSMNIATNDQSIYNNIYMTGMSGTYFERFYLLCSNICQKVGLNYIGFKFVMSSIAFFLLVDICKRYHIEDLKLPFFLILLSLFCINAEQSRYFFAYVIILYATKWLNKDEPYNALKYAIACLVASQFHTITIVYLVMLVFFLDEDHRALAEFLIFMFAVTMTVVMVVDSKFFSFVGTLIYMMTGIKRAIMWFDFSTKLGFIFPVVLQILMMYGLWKMEQVARDLDIDEKQQSLIHFTFQFAKVLCVFSPTYVLATEFARFQRPLMILFYFCVAIIFKHLDFKEKCRTAAFLVVFIVIFNAFTYGSPVPYFTQIYAPMFQ